MSNLSYEDKIDSLEKIGRLITIPLKIGKVVVRFGFHNRLLHSYSFEGDTYEECIDKIYNKIKEDVWGNCDER